MKLSVSLLAVVLAASLPLQPGEPPEGSNPASDRGLTAISPKAAEPPSAPLMVGDAAPDFTWQSSDRRFVSMKDLLVHGSLLLVFAPGDEDLQSIQRDREALLDLGVIPVAVMNARSGAAASKARRMGLSYTLVPDTRRVIAAQYGALDENRQSIVPAWFVVDRRAQVRALGRGSIPSAGFPRLAATVLAIPAGDVSLPAKSR
jgi:peroxiredoxin